MEPIYSTSSIVYTPEWTEGGYQDKCPIENRVRVHTPYECRCRPQGSLFSTNTEFSQHIKNKYHQTWLQNYHRTVCEDIELLNAENKGLKREMAILHCKLEKLEKRLERDTSERIRVEGSLTHDNHQLTEKIESMNLRILALLEENIVLERKLKKTEPDKDNQLHEKFDAMVAKHLKDTADHLAIQEDLKRIIEIQRETIDGMK
jgi:hypothetical protein